MRETVLAVGMCLAAVVVAPRGPCFAAGTANDRRITVAVVPIAKLAEAGESRHRLISEIARLLGEKLSKEPGYTVLPQRDIAEALQKSGFSHGELVWEERERLAEALPGSDVLILVVLSLRTPATNRGDCLQFRVIRSWDLQEVLPPNRVRLGNDTEIGDPESFVSEAVVADLKRRTADLSDFFCLSAVTNDGTAGVRKKLAQIVMPKMHVKLVSPEEMVRLIETCSVKCDPAGEGVHLMIEKTTHERRFNLEFPEFLPLGRMLDCLCWAGGCRYVVRNDGVLLVSTCLHVPDKHWSIVRPSGELPSAQVAAEAGTAREAVDRTEATLGAVRMPALELRDVSFKEVVTEMIREAGQAGIHFNWFVRMAAGRWTASVSLPEMSMRERLDVVCHALDYVWQIAGESVLIRPPGSAELDGPDTDGRVAPAAAEDRQKIGGQSPSSR